MSLSRNHILLIQVAADSRVYEFYDDIEEAVRAICSIYEEHLILFYKEMNLNPMTINYKVSDLMEFIAGFQDLTLLVRIMKFNFKL